MFCASAACPAACACWAVGGHGLAGLRTSGTSAQSPSAHTPGCVGHLARNSFVDEAPALHACRGSVATIGCGADGTVLTSVLVGMRSPPASSADSAVAPASRVLSRISTPRLRSCFCANSARLFGQLGEDEIARVEQDRPDLAAVDVPEVLRALAHEVVELGDRLDAREPAARHHEREQRAAAPPASRSMSASSRAWMMWLRSISASPRYLKGSACSGEAGLAREARHVAERDDEVVVLERRTGRGRNPELIVTILFLTSIASTVARVEVGPRAEPPDRRDDVEKADAAGDDFGEHGLEDEVVVLADQPDLDAGILLEELLELHGGVDAAEATAEDQDARTAAGCHGLGTGLGAAELF